MNADQTIATQFAAFLRPFFPPPQFKIHVQQWPYLRAIVTCMSDAPGDGDTALYATLQRLLACLEAEATELQEDENLMVVEGRFEGHKCRLTIILPLVLATDS